jgi:hypothetical protein
MSRQRVALEVVTAVLLGLVSVGTTFSAYQATVLTQQAADLASISQQQRDRNLTEFLSSQLTFRDDSRRVSAAFALQSELILRPENAEQVAAQRDALVAAGSPALREAWPAWADAGYGIESFPLADPDYTVALFAESQSLQYVSFVTDGMVDRLTGRAQTLTGAAVIFALALFVLGVAGVLTAPRAVISLAAGGAALFVVALVITLVASG